MQLTQLFNGHLPRLVMFDLDGTLVDSVPDLAAAVDQMLSQLDRPAAGVHQVRQWVGNGAQVLVRRALAGQLDHQEVSDQEAAEALPLFMAAYSQGHSQTCVYPGVHPVLRWLQSAQIPLALITNKPEQFIAPLLKEADLEDLFHWVVGGDTLPQQKPDPAALLHVMAQAQVSPRQALFIGDSRNDILAARAANVRCVAMRYGYNHGRPIEEENPDLVLDDLRALLLAG